MTPWTLKGSPSPRVTAKAKANQDMRAMAKALGTTRAAREGRPTKPNLSIRMPTARLEPASKQKGNGKETIREIIQFLRQAEAT